MAFTYDLFLDYSYEWNTLSTTELTGGNAIATSRPWIKRVLLRLGPHLTTVSGKFRTVSSNPSDGGNIKDFSTSGLACTSSECFVIFWFLHSTLAVIAFGSRA